MSKQSHTSVPVLPDDVCLQTVGVSKKFCKRLKRSMYYGCLELAGNMVGAHVDSSRLRRDEFWALDDVSFELRRGEILGLLGTNGSGKTTLLRLLAGIFPPDQGEIRVKGRVAALIALGVGFHPQMTGRDNVYLNGSLLGMSRAEVADKFDEIVAFSEIGPFIDAPVATYSSGMRVRLGFSVAIHVDPDVLLVDEVIAVGDVRFRSKCQERISDMLDSCAIVLVSHQVSTITRICNRVLILNAGQVAYQGPVAEGVLEYVEKYSPSRFTPKVLGTGDATVSRCEVVGTTQDGMLLCDYGVPLKVVMDVSVSPAFKAFMIVVQFMGLDGAYVVQCHSSCSERVFENRGVPQTVTLTIPSLTLNPGRYGMTVLVYDTSNVRRLAHLHVVKTLLVTGPFVGSTAVQWRGDWSVAEGSMVG